MKRIDPREPNGSPALLPSHGSSAHGPTANGSNGTAVLRSNVHELPPAAAPSSIDPKMLLSAFRRRWLLATTLGLLIGAGGAAAAYLFVPAPYESYSELEISAVQTGILFPTPEQRASFEVYKQTQMRKVKGPLVLMRALRDPKIANLPLIQEQDHPVDWLEKELEVSNIGSEFVRVSLSGDRPQDLALIVNAVTNAYLDDAVRGIQESRRNRLKALKELQQKKDEELREQRRALRSLAESLQAANPTQGDAKKQFLFELHIQMRKELADVHFELMRKKLLLAARQQNPETLAAVDIPDVVLEQHLAEHPEYQEVSGRVAQLEDLIRQYHERVPSNHPRLVAYQDELARRKTRLESLAKTLRPEIARQLTSAVNDEANYSDAQLQQQIAMLEAEKQQLDGELDKVKLEEGRTGKASFELEALDKDIEQTETIARTIADQIERIETEMESPFGIELYRPAEVPYKRELKKKYMATAAAGFGGFGLLVFGIVWLEHLSRRISSLDEVAGDLSMRVVGAVPIMPRWIANGKGSSRSAKGAYWHSVLTESIDSTRTMLLRDAKVEGMNTVMIASAMGGEGKTTLSCHLATSLARAGRRVVLIDCDMRRPSVHRVFGMPLTDGLCEVLRGEAQLDDVIYPAPQDNLSVVTAGQISQKVLQQLAQDGVGNVLEQLKREFDFVIVDSSPVLPVTDSLLIAQHVDGIIFSIRRDVSRMAKVTAACQRMGMLGVPILGAVVIGLDDGSYGFRYPYRYGYGYRNGSYAQPVAN